MTTKLTYETPKFVQLQASHKSKIDGHVRPAQHRDEVTFFSIYLGEPGCYQWVADFEYDSAARTAAHHMVMAFGCEFDRSQYDMVMDTSIQEVTPQPKGHPHAALMAEYAKDAAETDKPWERWEYQDQGCTTWHAVAGHPYWTTSVQYRRKPDPPKIIKVNGFEVPAPLDKVEVGTTVYAASPASVDLCDELEYGPWYSLYSDRKIVHATREAAVAHAKAMLGIDPKGDV